MAIATFFVLPLNQRSAWCKPTPCLLQVLMADSSFSVLTKAERVHSTRRMDIDVMKTLEVDEGGNAIKESRMISMRDIREVLKIGRSF